MTPWDRREQAASYGRELLVGTLTRMRELRDDDLPQLESWWLNPATVLLQANTIRPLPPGPIHQMFRSWSANDKPYSAGFCVVSLATDELLGHIALWSDDVRNRGATLAIVLGEEHNGKGYGPDALRVMLRYGFQEFGLHRIGLGVYAYNDRAMEVYRKVGFIEEGRLREAILHDGAFHDSVLMSVLEHEWRAAQDVD